MGKAPFKIVANNGDPDQRPPSVLSASDLCPYYLLIILFLGPSWGFRLQWVKVPFKIVGAVYLFFFFSFLF